MNSQESLLLIVSYVCVFHTLMEGCILSCICTCVSYIDFEISQGQLANTRNLYERLLEKTQHVKVFISFAKFEHESGMYECLKCCAVPCHAMIYCATW